ncbi:MAG: long-chain fatty acid--CoA ligase [Halieaceae bacterium]|nr:long-chain fatty acid--CoA ligase [Halieaceae bacterium]
MLACTETIRSAAIATTEQQNASALHELVANQAALRPHATALLWQGEAIDYATFDRRIARVAATIAGNGQPGERVAILAWNCPEFVELLYAVPAAGRIVVPLNARLAPAELAYQLAQAGVSILIGDELLLRPLVVHPALPPGLSIINLGQEYEHWLSNTRSSELPGSQETDPAWILYTSGTTGKPKGAVLSHQSLLAGLVSAAQGRPVRPDDIYLYPFPLFHVAAHNVLLQHQYGAAVVLLESFSPASTLACCRDYAVTSLSLAPTMIAMLVDYPAFRAEDLASVHTIGYGASSMPETLLRRVLDTTLAGMSQSYGMTELSGSIAFLSANDHRLALSHKPKLLKSVGRPLDHIQIKIVDADGAICPPGEPGEILVEAAQCMLGYWEQPAATADALLDGWLHTGDMGYFDTAGYLFIVDRKKDMIISGGENIASREVEEVLRQHATVADVAVVGMPHPKWGEAVCAVVVRKQPTDSNTLERHCRQLLAGYKTPKRFVFVDNLPVNASGKVDKRQLRQLIEHTPPHPA